MLGRALWLPNIVTTVLSGLVFINGVSKGTLRIINVNSNVMVLYLVACSAVAFLAMTPSSVQPQCTLVTGDKKKASCQLQTPPAPKYITTQITGGLALLSVTFLYWRYMNGSSTACMGIGGNKCSVIKILVGVLLALTSAIMVKGSKHN